MGLANFAGLRAIYGSDIDNRIKVVNFKTGVRVRVSRIPRSSLPAADLTAEMETMAQRRASMDDPFHLPNFPHMAWVDPSALPTIVIMPSLRARLECISLHRFINDTLVYQRSSPIHIVYHEDDA